MKFWTKKKLIPITNKLYHNTFMTHVLQRLTFDEQSRILEDLHRPRKQHHWIWWGFPLSRQDVPVHASDRTKQYAITNEEGLFLLSQPSFLEYYKTALKCLSQKSREGIEIYFSTIDLKKFRLHLRFFLDLCRSQSIPLASLIECVITRYG